MPEMADPKEDSSSSDFIERLQNDKVHDRDEKKEMIRAVHVLFAAAGTGKTRQMFELLQQHWGFYMLSPNIEPENTTSNEQEEREGSNILGAQRYAASRDTYTMFEHHPLIDPNWDLQEVNVFQPIIVAQNALLYEFLLRHPSATPTEWLWLQISCAAFDPFDALYRLFRLADTSYLGIDAATVLDAEIPGYFVPMCYSLLGERFWKPSGLPLCYCIDEAQTTIDNPKASAMFGHLYNSLTYFYVLSRDEPLGSRVVLEKQQFDQDESDSTSQDAPWQMGDDMPTINPLLLISGTSLNLEKLREMLAHFLTGSWGDDEPPVDCWGAYLVHNMFPLVSSDEDFWRLYQKHLTDTISEISRTQRSTNAHRASRVPLLSRSGRPLPLQDSGDGLDLAQAHKWLQKPLDVAPLPNMLKMLGQICRLVMDQEPRESPGKYVHLFADLEVALDHPDSDMIVSALALQLVTASAGGNSTSLQPFFQQAIRLLGESRKLSIDEVCSAVLNETTNLVALDSNLHDLALAFHEHLRNLYIRQLITSRSVGHRGRYRWSTIYIEEIMLLSPKLASKNASLAEIRAMIDQARKKTNEAAVEALKEQIRKMKAAGKAQLVRDLFRAGIRAEIMSTPTIFQDQSYAELVTYGFALTERDGETIKYTLAEPIAVHAIMEYLRTEGGEDYHDLMRQWLVDTQDDHEVQAMFGKATEWFVAMSLDRMFRYQEDYESTLPDLLNGSARRETLLKILAGSASLNPQQSTPISKLGSIWEWMRLYRTEGHHSVPTFMFPDIMAGPDLVFILENRPAMGKEEEKPHGTLPQPFSPSEKIVVAAQVKTGRSAKFEAAMETLIDSSWHSGTRENGRDEELTHWKGTKFLLLLICTGITVTREKLHQWMMKNSGRIQGGRFFCVLDETVTSDVWGQDFVALADAIKTKKVETRGGVTAQRQGGNRGNRSHGNGNPSESQLPNRSKKRPRNI
ncbi:uncharacterized protein NECHADRAFT_81200 [Fusarium vanettenii 77-13-4]|uniref:Uncharacterized protein n=1 Tax=Fusarium vanettenii (strain ATCC MYA-4622 / CBS 123669 / FGSC 9596 / NRRL 45880 / 77-13-4) TaxID=660122 RepID=C7ZHN4_FUSV7|nr:uncharacterized protein NECHADRAFT_81200 [Fusarium vanettenii 77-13-4]EEU36522.1 predicted protein [Fusarium vanettenii 77-13-4]